MGFTWEEITSQNDRLHVDQGMFPGAKNRVVPQPLGIVGVIVPWNFPVNLTFLPLATAFAAGNRAMVKMSENSIALTTINNAPKVNMESVILKIIYFFVLSFFHLFSTYTATMVLE